MCEVACLVHHRHSRSDNRHQYGVLHVSKAFLICHLEEKKSGLETHGKSLLHSPECVDGDETCLELDSGSRIQDVGLGKWVSQ